MADIEKIRKEAEDKMSQTVVFLGETLNRIRAGKANPSILDGIKVEYYGSLVPLSNVSSISTPDARTLIILPWEKNMLKVIEKAVLNSEVGITPENNGEVIRLGIPPLTEERRKLLVKQVKQETESAKMSVRNARREAVESIKKSIKEGLPEDMGKDAETEMQKLHDKYIRKIDDIFSSKEQEIMKV